MAMDTDLMEEALGLDNEQIQKGQIVLYEGEESVVIGVAPLLVIKTEDRVICGSLHNRIKLIKK